MPVMDHDRSGGKVARLRSAPSRTRGSIPHSDGSFQFPQKFPDPPQGPPEAPHPCRGKRDHGGNLIRHAYVILKLKNAWSYTSTPPYVFMTYYSSAGEVGFAWKDTTR